MLIWLYELELTGTGNCFSTAVDIQFSVYIFQVFMDCLSGSGPAYFFLAMEALEAAAVHHGLDARTARLLTLETAFGAAKMALEGGGLNKLFDQAVAAAIARARELADLFGKN